MIDVQISDQKARLDLHWIRVALKRTYWGARYSSEQINEAISNSLCIGAYCEGEQVGFLRIVTDKAIFSSITDVLVAESFRGQGIGRQLVTAALAHPYVESTICVLNSREENRGFYLKLGFAPMLDGVMKRDPS